LSAFTKSLGILATAVGAVFGLGARKTEFLNVCVANNTVKRDKFLLNKACDEMNGRVEMLGIGH
jgi:hypothetical protein